jgi:hypothetical protein
MPSEVEPVSWYYWEQDSIVVAVVCMKLRGLRCLK